MVVEVTNTLPLASHARPSGALTGKVDAGLPSPVLYVRNDVPGALIAVPSRPPASVAGQSVLTGYTPQELTFIVGKHLSYYRGEHYIRTMFQTKDELKLVLVAAML